MSSNFELELFYKEPGTGEARRITLGAQEFSVMVWQDEGDALVKSLSMSGTVEEDDPPLEDGLIRLSVCAFESEVLETDTSDAGMLSCDTFVQREEVDLKPLERRGNVN